jgi:hypothetical protein
VKKCQELERKAHTIVPNFSKDGAPAKKKKKKHRCSSSRVQLALATTGTSPPEKKIAKNQNSTGKSPNCNHIKAAKSAAEGKKLEVFKND